MVISNQGIMNGKVSDWVKGNEWAVMMIVVKMESWRLYLDKQRIQKFIVWLWKNSHIVKEKPRNFSKVWNPFIEFLKEASPKSHDITVFLDC